jgi:uncharacterized protein (TIGR02598 family)
MSGQNLRRSGFSLVEVTLALGVAGFCLLALMALLPIGVKTNQTAFSQTAAATILSDIVADMRAARLAATSPQYLINFSSTQGQHLCFDSEGGFANCTPPTAPPANSRYRVVVTIFPSDATHYATYANVKISWPAVVDPSTTAKVPAGSIETVAAFDRF